MFSVDIFFIVLIISLIFVFVSELVGLLRMIMCGLFFIICVIFISCFCVGFSVEISCLGLMLMFSVCK